MSRRLTIAILVMTAVVLIVWDIYVAVNGVSGDTISEVVLSFAQKHPVIPFVFGVVMGHLFWPQHSRVGGA